MKMITLEIPDSLFQEMNDFVVKKDIFRSHMIRKAIKDFIERHKDDDETN